MRFFLIAALLLPLTLHSAAAQQPSAADMPQEMVWVDRSGQILGRAGDQQAAMFYPRFSPDGRYVAVSSRAGDGTQGGRNIWIHDLEQGSKRQVTFARGNNNFPVWSPDGKKIVFNSSRSGTYQLFLKDLESDAEEKMILETELREFPSDWSPDGKYLALSQDDHESVHHIYYLTMDGGSFRVREVLKRPGVWHDCPVFSPNGRYVAFASNRSGSWEVYVAASENPGRVWQVSRPLSRGWAGGGGQPRWSGDGRELFYMMGDTLMAVEVETEGAFRAGEPAKLFSLAGMKGNFPEESPWRPKYDVARDGQKFIFIRTIHRP